VSIDVLVTTTIERPPAEVAAYAMDPANDTVWIGGIKEVHWVTEPPLQIGSRVRRVATFLGRRIDYVLEVADLTRPSRLVMRSVQGPFPMVVTYTFSGEDGTTQAGVRVQGGSGVLFWLLSSLMARQVRTNLSSDLRRLKQRAETVHAP
jgi:hypothetical protein